MMCLIVTIFDHKLHVAQIGIGETFYLLESCMPSSNTIAQTPTIGNLQLMSSELLERLKLCAFL